MDSERDKSGVGEKGEIETNVNDSDQATQDQLPTEAESEFQNDKIEYSGEKGLVHVEELEDYKLLLFQFPDIDLDFLMEELMAAIHGEDVYDINVLVTKLLTSTYPKSTDDNSMAQKNRHMDRLMGGEVDSIEEYLKIYEDPEKFFITSPTPETFSDLYKDHSKAQLYNDFRSVKSHCIDQILEVHGYRYASPWLTVHTADKEHKSGKPNKWILQYAVSECPVLVLPAEPSEQFYRERQYIKNRQRILDYQEQKRSERVARLLEAEEREEIKFCPMCYNGELLDDEVVRCEHGHEFCTLCVRGSVEVGVKQGRANHSCLLDECTAEYRLDTLRAILRPATLSLQLKLLVQNHVNNSGIENLVSCPYCAFFKVIDEPDNTVFTCLNPDCQKQTCRLCKEDNHLPLRCGEIEQASERTMRTFIEKRMNEATLRKCHKCSQNIYKTHGCNLFQCECGGIMCYHCRAIIQNKDHFKLSPQCLPDPTKTTDQVHREEMREAAERAKAEYLALHPEAASALLRYDPMKTVEIGKNQKKQGKKRSGSMSGAEGSGGWLPF